MRRTFAPLALLLGAVTLAACGAQPGVNSAVPTTVVTVTATPEVVTVTATPEPATESPAKIAKAAPKKAPAPARYEMPNEVGNILQDAQEDIEHILDVPVWPLLQSHDVKDGWRFQVIDRDWKVCDQQPAPGATFTESTVIDFGVVKLDEDCP